MHAGKWITNAGGSRGKPASMTGFALAALARKRAELAGEGEALQARLDRLRADLAQLDATIRTMDPARAPELGREPINRE